jgi:predicted phosphodiesterase
MYQERPRLKGNKLAAYNHITKKEDRILVIGDLHLPFCLDGYLEHCKKVYSDNNLNKVIFIGDIIDSHAYSYHEPDVNGMSAGDELEAAIEDVKEWYDTFPVADVLIGNHDRLAYRKMTTGGVPKQWIKAITRF